MMPLLENAKCVTDLDFAGFRALNLGEVIPPPPNLVAIDDPRLSDARTPLDGSVTDVSVALDAAIAQSKLNLNGQIPASWLGQTSSTAARGDLAEYVANKAQPGGYASLGSDGKIPASQVPPGVGTGTVTSVGLTAPAQFTLSGSPVTGSGTLALGWVSVPAGSWFGNPSSGAEAPTFQITPLPLTLVPVLDATKIPNLDASKITTGIFPVARGGTGTNILAAVGNQLRAVSTTAFDDFATTTISAKPANPAGTINTFGVMMGLALTVTPQYSGTLLVIVSGRIDTSTANTYAGTEIFYGTGTPPVNGVGVVGTGVGNAAYSLQDPSAVSPLNFTCHAVITGLVIRTPYWFDMMLVSSNATATATLTNLSVSIVEL